MNPKKEFIKAVMSVLRLEQNIYVTASIEEIVDRIDVGDYTMFIAYLGEREGDYERPIQTIAKAVEEFYEKKNKPMRTSILEIIDETNRRFMSEENRIYQEDRIPKLDEEGSWFGKYIIDKEKTRSRMQCIKPKEGRDFYIDGKSLPYSSIEPLINKCGGLSVLIDIYLDDKENFYPTLKKHSGLSAYQLPSIVEKIELDAKNNIDDKVLGIMKSKAVISGWR